ncbi:MAG: 50S ribosomal protein L11 methyltransferase [Campylobacterota bacterium]
MNTTYNQLVLTPGCDTQLFAEYTSHLLDEGAEIGSEELIVRSSGDLTEVAAALQRFADTNGITLQIKTQQKQNSDWIEKYKRSVQPVTAGNFYIRPSWCESKEGINEIIIDPALSFGSGHHATTASCLQAISRYVQKEDCVLDVGCGSGILSIAAQKLQAHVDICDSDEQALVSAKHNFTKNSAAYRDAWTGSAGNTQKQYDVVIANIVSDVLIMLKSQLQKRLKPGGVLILSGILQDKEAAVKEAYAQLKEIETIHQDEWSTIMYRGVNEKL